ESRRRWNLPAGQPEAPGRVPHCTREPTGEAAVKRKPAWRSILSTLQISAARLLAFDGLEKRLEVALAETPATLALDHLVKERGTVLHRTREDLQHVAF